jgi:CheY-like chemotaxis protein
MTAVRTVLLVDDDLAVVSELSRGLRAAGHSVTTARDGLDAFELATTTLPDVILADVVMPGLNGYQLCRRLRQHAPTAATPVVLMGDIVNAADRLWAAEVGARELIAKPVAVSVATAMVAAVAGPSP